MGAVGGLGVVPVAAGPRHVPVLIAVRALPSPAPPHQLTKTRSAILKSLFSPSRGLIVLYRLIKSYRR